MPRRIAFCITELDPGGAEHALVEIVTRMPREDWEPKVFCLGPDAALAQPLRDAGIAVQCLGATTSRDLGVIDRLRRGLRGWRPELLQTFLFHANVTGRIAGRLAGVPVIVSGLRVAEREKSWHRRLDRWTGRMVQQHVAVSEGVAAFARETLRFPAERVTVIPNGVDVTRFDQVEPYEWNELGIPAGSKVLLAAGRLHGQKGFDLLLQAVQPLLVARRDWTVVIAGEGPQRAALVRQRTALGLDERVWLPGRIDEFPRYLKGADLFVLSSRWEGMPNVLLEAIASRVPVVATDVEGVRELLAAGSPEQVVPPHSVGELRQAIQGHMNDPASSLSAVDSLYRLVSSEFTWDSVARKYAALYTRLLG
ncbi:MAG: glycosyltransferase [Planctomycetaceae bacterium]|nr:glycosyltransferase [Planctomycetaceae bacterium]